MILRKQRDSALRGYAAARSWMLGGAVTRGPRAPRVALTFDDGPDSRFTPDICALLGAHGARASFFMLASRVEADPDLARALVSEGHEPCTHLYSHDRRAVGDAGRFRQEMADSLRIIEGATGEKPLFLRFPFAFMGAQKPDAIWAQFGVRTVHWSFSSLDSRRDAEGIVKRVERFLFPGAIVLMHDGVGAHSRFARDRRETVRALPGVLEACKARGLAPVTLSALLGISGTGGDSA